MLEEKKARLIGWRWCYGLLQWRQNIPTTAWDRMGWVREMFFGETVQIHTLTYIHAHTLSPINTWTRSYHSL